MVYHVNSNDKIAKNGQKCRNNRYSGLKFIFGKVFSCIIILLIYIPNVEVASQAREVGTLDTVPVCATSSKRRAKRGVGTPEPNNLGWIVNQRYSHHIDHPYAPFILKYI